VLTFELNGAGDSWIHDKIQFVEVRIYFMKFVANTSTMNYTYNGSLPTQFGSSSNIMYVARTGNENKFKGPGSRPDQSM
jgi:hypothetical protein